ncbi:MAG: dCTP deaminase [Chloroflexi bacterium]|nr:dCTP deaminase [Chloroflexota bacterium]
MLSDFEIEEEVLEGSMIVPYIGGQVREQGGVRAISFGQSSYGYDIRLGEQVQLFSPANRVAIDPKAFDDAVLLDAEVFDEGNGRYIVIPPHSFALGHTVERFRIPPDVLVICLGKSTYARTGIVLNVTPFEPGWEGYATLEISNTTPLPVKVYVGEGIGQLIFFRGELCGVTYADRSGKYQDQPERIVTAMV